jgi:hypothetical protein
VLRGLLEPRSEERQKTSTRCSDEMVLHNTAAATASSSTTTTASSTASYAGADHLYERGEQLCSPPGIFGYYPLCYRLLLRLLLCLRCCVVLQGSSGDIESNTTQAE